MKKACSLVALTLILGCASAKQEHEVATVGESALSAEEYEASIMRYQPFVNGDASRGGRRLDALSFDPSSHRYELRVKNEDGTIETTGGMYKVYEGIFGWAKYLRLVPDQAP